MDKVEAGFLESQKHEPMVLFCYIDGIFFISIHGGEELQEFPKEHNKTHKDLKFMHKSSKEKILFLDLFVSLPYGKLYTDPHIKVNGCHQSNAHHLIQIILRNQEFIVRCYV